MFVSGIDANSKKIINRLKYAEGTSVKKSKYTEIESIRLDSSDVGCRVTFSGAEEEGASFSSITKNSVISVALSSTDGEDPETARIRRVYVSNLSASGVVTSVFEDEGDDYFVIDGKAYRASKSYYNTYNGGESIDYSDIGVGDCVSLYLDYDGRFAYMEKDMLKNIGILIQTAKCGGIGDEYKLKLVSSDGRAEEYKITAKKYDKLNLGSAQLPSFAEYKTSGDYITDIDFNTDFKEYGSFTCLKNSNRFGNYFYGADTLMFLYDGAKNDGNTAKSERYYTVTEDWLKNKRSYSADVFIPEKSAVMRTVILYEDRAEPDICDDVMLVSEITRVLNDNGDDVYCLVGYSNGEKISAELLPDAAELPKCGDVIRYAMNPDNKIKRYTEVCNYDSEDFEINTFTDDISFAKCNTVERVTDGIITANINGNYINYYTDSGTSVYNIENYGKKNICAGSVYDITEDDRIFIRFKEGIADEIFVWKNK